MFPTVGYGSPSWCLPIFPVSPFLSLLLPVFRQGFSSGYSVGVSSHGGIGSCSSFYSCLLLLILALVAVSSCPPLYPSVVRFRFDFLVRIPPFRGFSALVFGWSLSSSVTVRCFVLLSIVWDRRLCFLFSSQSLGAHLPRSNLRSLRDGVRPLGRVGSLLGFLRSFSFLVLRMPFGSSELVVFCFFSSLSLVFVPLFRWVFSSWGSVLLLFRGFSSLRFGLWAFFALLWFSLAVRVGPSPALSSVSLFFQQFFADVVLFWSLFTFLPVCPCSPCLGRFLFLWRLFSFAWSSGLLFCSSARFLVAFSVFSVLRASLSVVISCLPSASAFCLFFFASFVTRSNLSSFVTGSSLWAESAQSVVAFLSVLSSPSLSVCLSSSSWADFSASGFRPF